MESFDKIQEGLVYAYLSEIDDKFVTLKIKNKEYSFLNKIKNEFKASSGDFVRAFIKDKEVIFLEKLSEKNYLRFKELLESIEQIVFMSQKEDKS